MSDQPTYGLWIGKRPAQQYGGLSRNPLDLEWQQVIGVEMPDRAALEQLALALLRTPGVLGVQIRELEWTGTGTNAGYWRMV